MKLRRLILAAGVFSSGLVPGAATPPGAAPAFVDDRGTAIDAPLTARLLTPQAGVPAVVELRGKVELPKDWAGPVEIEGESHGPSRTSVRELLSGPGPLAIPRKATLRVGRAGGGAFSLSYFALVDGALVRSRDLDVADSATLRLPAGNGVVVARHKEKGRDVRLVSLRPGSVTGIEPSYARSNVAVLRVLRLADGSPVARATVSAEIGAGDGASDPNRERLCQSDESGFCLVASTAPHLSAVIEADGLTAIRSQFALEAGDPRLIETIKMSAGGRPTFQVSVDGNPAVAVPVLLRLTGSYAAGTPASGVAKHSGVTDDQGRWRPGIVAPGAWLVRIRPEKNQPAFEKRIDMAPGSEDLVDLQLSRIRITGALTRGARGVAGAAIVIAPRDTGEKSYSTESDAKEQQVSTDEDGEFEAFVWREGVYNVFAGGLARKTVSVPIVGTRVLLRVAEGDVVCVVVDADGRPIEDAAVTYKEAEPDQSWTEMAKTDRAGRVVFNARGGSQVTVVAAAVGFEKSEKTTFTVPVEGPISPVTLRLEKDDILAGRFVGQMGLPIARADLWATSTTGQLLNSSPATDATGRFEVSRAGGREFRLFFVSAEAPLTLHRVYDVGQTEEVVFAPAERGLLEIQFTDTKGGPMASRSAVLQSSGVLIQPALLARHLALRGLLHVSDVRGNQLIPDLAPGDYAVVVPDVPSPDGIGPLRVSVYVAPGRNSVRLTLEEAARP